MARTHGAGTLRPEYSNDGVVLGKNGAPIPTTPTRGISTLHPHGEPPKLQHMDDGELVVAPVKEPEPPKAPVRFEFHLDATTIGRNMDGYQLFQILNVFFAKTWGQPIVVDVSEEEARNGVPVNVDGKETVLKFSSDMRWHFKRREVVEAVKPEDEGG